MENVIAEIQVSYSTNSRIRQQITTSYSAYEVLQSSWYSGRMELQEEFKVLLLNRANHVLGIYNLSKGGVSSTIVDLKLLFGVVLKANASSIVICHNHPSGKLAPSDADIEITNKIKEACKLLNIHFFDHIIISHLGYYSFAENKVC
ncbi:putative DNA repair protein [Flavobacterium psychrophilum]|uniref:JAB domain-containing protein n=1 Tax=Flavobacterium psychrophilum TaxID=96345 RepID=UPI000B7C4923|nr:JAB domain-containing protein [Flavobacterium psychrophilum]SNB23933.1 putative DNA repair protein [Flavobacterium psychrophilum]